MPGSRGAARRHAHRRSQRDCIARTGSDTRRCADAHPLDRHGGRAGGHGDCACGMRNEVDPQLRAAGRCCVRNNAACSCIGNATCVAPDRTGTGTRSSQCCTEPGRRSCVHLECTAIGSARRCIRAWCASRGRGACIGHRTCAAAAPRGGANAIVRGCCCAAPAARRRWRTASAGRFGTRARSAARPQDHAPTDAALG